MSSADDRALSALGNRDLLAFFRGEDLADSSRTGRDESTVDVCTASRICAGISMARREYVSACSQVAVEQFAMVFDAGADLAHDSLSLDM